MLIIGCLFCLQHPSPASMWPGKFFPFKICGRPIYHFGVDRFVWPSTSYFFYSEIAARVEGTHLFFGIFGYGDSAGVRLSEIICESNFRRHQWNYELSDELFSWIDFPFVLSAENEYEGAISNGGTIPWYKFSLFLQFDPLLSLRSNFRETFRGVAIKMVEQKCCITNTRSPLTF